MDVSEIMQKIERSAGDDPLTALTMMRQLSKQANTWAREHFTVVTNGNAGFAQPNVCPSDGSIEPVIVLSRDNRDEWAGTFGVLLRAFLDDVLSDGPARLSVVIEGGETPSGQPLHDRYIGMVVGYGDGRLTFYDGVKVELGLVVAVGL